MVLRLLAQHPPPFCVEPGHVPVRFNDSLAENIIRSKDELLVF
jgi:hypothetical protein